MIKRNLTVEGNKVFLDIETNIPDSQRFKDMGALAISYTYIVCMKVHFDKLGTLAVYIAHSKDELKEQLGFINRVGPFTVIGHNIMRFDLPVLLDTWEINLKKYYNLHGFVDTMLLSKMMYPDRLSHSLKAISSVPKKEMPTVRDAPDYDTKMLEYCLNDVDMVEDVLNQFLKDTKNMPPDNAIKLEHKVAELWESQCFNGVHFNVEAAEELAYKLEEEMKELKRKVATQYANVPIPQHLQHKPPSKQFNKNGTPSKGIENYCKKYGFALVTSDGKKWTATNRPCSFPEDYTLPLTAPLKTTEALDLGRPQQVKEYLLSVRNWSPTLWNTNAQGDKTSPRLYDTNGTICPNIKTTGFNVQYLQRFLTLRSRLGQLEGWLKNSRVVETGIISADADTIGARTARVTHRIVANVPRVTTEYGKEFRSLFGPPHGYVQVGWDASALEARIEAHYTYIFDGGKYAKELIEGDIHTKNQQLLGLPDRDTAKTWKYAITYNAQPPKLAKTFGWTLNEARQKYDAFWDFNPALKKLKSELEAYYDMNGYIIGIDGRKLYPKHKGTCLNTLLQGGGAILMKYAMVFADKLIRTQKLSAFPMIRYHDEEQWASLPHCAQDVGECGVTSIKLAGKYLKLKVEMDGEYTIGKNWAESH